MTFKISRSADFVSAWNKMKIKSVLVHQKIFAQSWDFLNVSQ